MQQRVSRVYGVVFLFALSLGLAAGAVAETRLPSARVSFESTSIGILVGFSRGEGVLSFGGEEYPFAIKGWSLFALGGSKVEGGGVVYDLNDVAEFEGTYRAGEFGLTTIQGGTSMVMTNGNGVRLHVDTLQRGLELNMGGGGVRIELVDPVQTPADVETPAARQVSSGAAGYEPAL